MGSARGCPGGQCSCHHRYRCETAEAITQKKGISNSTRTTDPSPSLSLCCSLDVDPELWQVLDLCSDEELEAIYNILHGASPFSPVVKSIVREDEPPLLQLRGRTSIMHKVRATCHEQQFALPHIPRVFGC